MSTNSNHSGAQVTTRDDQEVGLYADDCLILFKEEAITGNRARVFITQCAALVSDSLPFEMAQRSRICTSTEYFEEAYLQSVIVPTNPPASNSDTQG